MTAELRKYAAALILSHQYLHQLEPDVRHAVLGNAGTLITFRLGAEDAPLIAAELASTITAQDVQILKNHQVYVRLLIDGAPSPPVSGITLRPEQLAA